MTLLRSLRRPIVAAPMAGGPTTPALAAAVSNAGGLGFLAAGMLSTERMLEDIHRIRTLTSRPFGVNVFLPNAEAEADDPNAESEGDDPNAEAEADNAVHAYAQRLAPEAARWGVTLGRPVGGDDQAPAKIAALLDEPVAVVSFVFDLPDKLTVRAFHDGGSEVWATVNHPDAAVEAQRRGVDAIVVQGTEAGAHRGGAFDGDDYGLLPLLRLAAARVGTPLVAAGGIVDGAGIAAALAAGASAVQLGTAFLRCPEAGTLPMHRAAVAEPADTQLTRAFTGRRARAVVNDFVTAYDATAPRAYPQVLQVTQPLLAAARRANDASSVNLWAGQAHELTRDVPAARLVEELMSEAFAALGSLNERFTSWE